MTDELRALVKEGRIPLTARVIDADDGGRFAEWRNANGTTTRHWIVPGKERFAATVGTASLVGSPKPANNTKPRKRARVKGGPVEVQRVTSARTPGGRSNTHRCRGQPKRSSGFGAGA